MEFKKKKKSRKASVHLIAFLAGCIKTCVSGFASSNLSKKTPSLSPYIQNSHARLHLKIPSSMLIMMELFSMTFSRQWWVSWLEMQLVWFVGHSQISLLSL